MDRTKRIIIAGMGKSGTTALYFRVKNSMPETTQGIFEPGDFTPFETFGRSSQPLVTKVLTPLPADFPPRLSDFFTHRILIVRDPRDVLVSAFLYNNAYAYLWNDPPERITECLRLLRDKETASSSISVLGLLAAFRDDFNGSEFADFLTRTLDAGSALAAGQHDFYLTRYELLIRGQLDTLAEYLGFPLTAGDRVDEAFQRVERTKSAGSWKDWFLPEDIAYFRPLFEPYLRRFGYDADDWTTNSEPVIRPSHCSEYVLRVVNERRLGAGLPPHSEA